MESMSRLVYMWLMLAGLGAAAWAWQRRRLPSSLTAGERTWLGLSAFIGAMLGAKLPFIGQLGWEGILSGQIWFMDGKTILGGIFGGYLAVEIAKARMGIQVGTGDGFAVPIAVAVIIGRVGCFWAGCCYGTVTDLPWGVAFPKAADASGVFRHPTQLYEVLFHGVAILVLLVAERGDWIRGQRLKAYLLAYLAYRFGTEWIRPEARWWLGLTAYQLACLGLSLVLVGLWYRDVRRRRRGSADEIEPSIANG